MIKAERQDRVRQLLEEQGTVSVKEISDALGVSDMTIRRDLEELASLGEIERVLACDALNGIAFKDDSQVDMGAVTKRPRSPYGTKPRIDIYIEYFVEEYVKEKK